MWVLIQSNEKGTRRKFVVSESYNKLLSYINKFINVKKYDDYHFVSNDKEIIEFVINLSECLDRR